jgi:hypothetical protein
VRYYVVPSNKLCGSENRRMTLPGSVVDPKTFFSDSDSDPQKFFSHWDSDSDTDSDSDSDDIYFGKNRSKVFFSMAYKHFLNTIPVLRRKIF